MNKIMKFSEIVLPNGKTIRENNYELNHNIPLKTLVEVGNEYSDKNGIRLFVVLHGRDCDGTPLYGLSAEPDWSKDEVFAMQRIVFGFPEQNLIVIRKI